jgi:poly(A) polymerase
LEKSGLRAEILPELEYTQHVEKCLQMLQPGIEADFAMAVLLHDVPIARVNGIVERLKFSRAEMHHVVALVENLPTFYKVRQMSVGSLKRFFRLARFEDHLQLMRIHGVASREDLQDYSYALDRHREWSEADIAPKPLITGEDLIALGFVPGPRFKEILTRVEDEQLEGRLVSHVEAIDFVKRHYGEVRS